MKNENIKMNIRPGVLFWKVEENYYLFDQVSLQQYKINSVAFEVLQRCDGKHKLSSIVDSVCEKYIIDNRNDVNDDIFAFVENLEKLGFILVDVKLNSMFKEYISGEAEEEKFTPGLLYWEVTNACNKKCIMCYNPSMELENDELTYEEGINLINKFKEIGGMCIIFTGGEPVLRNNDLIGWIQHCSEIGIQTELFTNGTLIDEEYAAKLKTVGLGYCRVSIHGSNCETHDYITGIKGTFDEAIQGIKNLVKAEVKTAWSVVTNKKNFMQLRKIVEKAIELGCHGVVVGSVDLIGRGALAQELALDAEHEELLWRFLDESIYVYGDKIRFSWGSDMCKTEAWDYYVLHPSIPKDEWKYDANRYMRYVKNSLCGVGQRAFAITANGNITPCPALYDIVLGNFRRDDLLDIWNNSEVLNDLRHNLLEDFNHCGNCGMRYACVGGCRANAFHTDGSILGRDFRRCKVHKKREKCVADKEFSFYSKIELEEKKYTFENKNAKLDEFFNKFDSEGKGPWIPYIGISNRLKIQDLNKKGENNGAN